MIDLGNEPIYPWGLELRGGLIKREYFAAAALQGLLANPNTLQTREDLARSSVRLADALIAALQEPAK
jgi:hypothetical protein